MSDTTARRRMIEKIRPALAYDYHVNNYSPTQAADRNGVSVGAMYTAKEMYCKDEVRNLYGGRESVIIVSKTHLEMTIDILKKEGIEFRLASNKHQLIETFESSINQ